MNTLKKLALKYKADKIRDDDANYMDDCEIHFNKIKKLKLSLLEIGINEGGSLKMWAEYFKRGLIIGVDISPGCSEFAAKRTRVYIGDQTDAKLFDRILNDTPQGLDIIIDDGGHTMEQQKTTFNILFPRLNPGGIYIIEDLHTSYWPEFGGKYLDENNTISSLKKMIDNINYSFYKVSERAGEFLVKEPINYLDQHIKSLHFYRSLCFIYKS